MNYSFFFLGLRLAGNMSISIIFASNLTESNLMLGYVTGSYGVGGVAGPILATAIASHSINWSYFYLVTLVVVLVNLGLAAWSFRGLENDSREFNHDNSRQTQTSESRLRILVRALRHRVTLLAAVFVFAYQGAEVALSGWIISYLIEYRDADPAKIGYVTAGFWGGLTIGRFFLPSLAGKVGKNILIYILTVCAIASELLVWFVPNVVGEASKFSHSSDVGQ
jgi:fucose permease